MVGLTELEKFEIGVNTLIRDGGGVISINDDVGTVWLLYSCISW